VFVLAILAGTSATPLQQDTKVAELIVEKAGPALLEQLQIKDARDALEFVRSIPRDLDFLELFAGCGRLTQAFRQFGWSSYGVDYIYDKVNHDARTPVGQAHIVKSSLRVRSWGMFSASPVCSTMVWMSRAHTQRSKENPEGDVTRKDVRDGNAMSEFVTFIFELLGLRLVWWLCEQPVSSAKWKLAHREAFCSKLRPLGSSSGSAHLAIAA
jgi:hypothetical protein